MSTLNGRTPQNTYGNLLQVDNSNLGIDATLRTVEDGKGNSTPIRVSSDTAGLISGLNRQTASYQLVLSDAFKTIEMNVAAANNLTVPDNATVAFPIGTVITVTQYGAGPTTIVAGGSTVIRSLAGNLIIPGQYGMVRLTKIATDEWYLTMVGFSSVTTLDMFSTVTYTNQPNSEQYLNASSLFRAIFDTTSYNYVRVSLRITVGSASANNPRVYPQYSTDGGTNWITVGDGTLASGDAASLVNVGQSTSNWVVIPLAAKSATSLWRPACNGGDGTADPVWITYLQFKN